VNQQTNEHQPVMVEDVIEALNMQAKGIYLDATFGRGGHTKALLEHIEAEGRVWALDRDPEALPIAQSLCAQDPRFFFKKGNFSDLYAFCEEQGIVGSVNGIIMDLGVSSPQLDTPERGFSFRLDGPLDMRMDPTQGTSAAEWINSAEESEIAMVLKEFGEERFHRRIARAIITARVWHPITTTLQLAAIVKKANPIWEQRKHPATRSFQAIRLWVNRELEALALGLEQGLRVLKPGGRLAVISFHSLEDRMVKQFIRKNEQGTVIPRHLPVYGDRLNAICRRVGKKKRPSPHEILNNPRARSALLRVTEKLWVSEQVG